MGIRLRLREWNTSGRLVPDEEVRRLRVLFNLPPKAVAVHRFRWFLTQGAVAPHRSTSAAALLVFGGLLGSILTAGGLTFFGLQFAADRDLSSLGALALLAAAGYFLFLPMTYVSARAPHRMIFVLTHELVHIEVEERIRRGECIPRFREHLTNCITYVRLRDGGYPVDELFA